MSDGYTSPNLKVTRAPRALQVTRPDRAAALDFLRSRPRAIRVIDEEFV